MLGEVLFLFPFPLLMISLSELLFLSDISEQQYKSQHLFGSKSHVPLLQANPRLVDNREKLRFISSKVFVHHVLLLQFAKFVVSIVFLKYIQ